MMMSRNSRVLLAAAIALSLGTGPLAVRCSADETQTKPPVVENRSFHGLQEVNPPPSPPAEQVIAIVGGLLIDGRGGTPVGDSVVLIQGDRIIAAGTRAVVNVPDNATEFDATGFSVLPGLVDSHFHVGVGQSIRDLPPLFLAHGVTTARDPGRHIEAYDPVLRSKRSAPRLFLTGPHYDRSPPAYPENSVIIEDAEHARRATRQYVSQGASAIKVYFRLPLESMRATCQTAHELGIPVTAHLELVDADQAILAGLDGVEHITSFGTALADAKTAENFRTAVDAENDARREGRYRLWASLDLQESPRTKALIGLIVQQNVVVSPTLATFERRAGDKDVQEYHVRGFANMMKFVGMCHAAGAVVVTGSHTWSRHVKLGWAYQREMELLLESGLSPMAVITASTINNARFLGCADRLGSIEAEKLADLVLVKGNPLEDIRAMYNVHRVMQNGRWIKPPKTN